MNEINREVLKSLLKDWSTVAARLTVLLEATKRQIRYLKRIHGLVSTQHKNLEEKLRTSVEDLALSVRSINCLRRAKIRFVGDLVQKTEKDLLGIRNFGRTSLNEVTMILSEMGLELGMELPSGVNIHIHK